MKKTISKKVLNRGKKAIDDANAFIELAGKFPPKSNGPIKPDKGGWFKAVSERRCQLN